MEQQDYQFMSFFKRWFMMRKRNWRICDVGSYDVNGTYRPLFIGHRYVGTDISYGPNVDIVTEPYTYPFKDETFDAVVSGSTIEHVRDIYRWVQELKRIVKVGGFVCIIGPSRFNLHHPHPVDCWRILPDGMRFLVEEVARLALVKIRTNHTKRGTITCMAVGRRDA